MEPMIDDKNGNRRSRLSDREQTEDNNALFFGTGGDPSTSWVGEGARNTPLRTPTSREKTEGGDGFFSETKGDSSTSSVGEGE